MRMYMTLARADLGGKLLNLVARARTARKKGGTHEVALTVSY